MNEFKTELKRMFSQIQFDEKNQGEIYLNIDEEKVLNIINILKEKKLNLINLFAAENFDNFKGISLFYVFEKEGYKDILIIQTIIKSDTNSIAALFPTARIYEREIQDGFGVVFNQSYDTRRLFLHEIFPENFHPLLKSFKNAHIPAKKIISASEEYLFKEVKGEGIYQVPVGPVHAGIIAPGHFRFSVIGETIFNLEIRHFWKHRGIEKLAEDKTPEEGLLIAEAICGDETVANALAYCQSIEKICKIKVPPRAEHLRMLFAEFERIYSLLGDLAGMVVDIAYPVGASPLFILREEMLRWNEKLSGSRFYKEIIKIGGLTKDVAEITLKELIAYLDNFNLIFIDCINSILKVPLVIDRFETTGIIKKELLIPLNLSGPLARASGLNKDVRIDHPYGVYASLSPSNKVLETGDVLARFRVKAATIKDSIRMIKHILKIIPSGNIITEYNIKDGFAFSIVESSRGQNINFIEVKHGKINRYKVRTASFCNWYSIEEAVLGNIIPDFPLINKSMNLSYEGNDL